MISTWWRLRTKYKPFTALLISHSRLEAPASLHEFILHSQLVWAETKEVGCGYMSHFDGKYYRQQLACNYGPGGNMVRDVMYDTDTSKSCPSGSTENDGLCAW